MKPLTAQSEKQTGTCENLQSSGFMPGLSPAKEIIILGFGVTGQALARFCEDKKIPHWIWDDFATLQKPQSYYLGQLTSEKLNADFAKNIFAILPSPGVSQAHPLYNWGEEQDLPILSDIEWAASFLNGDFIGVTGTNGKSTTVKLIDQLLNDAGKSCGLFGNYGQPLIDACTKPPHSFYVLEESSYQLELIQKLRHKISICLNITEDHLDRYADINAYRKAKENIFKNSASDDLFIYNYDNHGCLLMAKHSKAKNIPISLAHSFSEGGFLQNGQMIVRLHGKEFTFDTQSAKLKGWHNIENMLAALVCVLHIDQSPDAVLSYRKTLAEFSGLPHRLEWVQSIDGVDYYDDSKATNVHSVAMALASFDDNVILIAGGRDKGSDYSPLNGLVRAKVKLMLLIGESQKLLHDHFAEIVPTQNVGTLANAVQHAKSVARPGDVVLLSPACSSFDQFKNYHERGLVFQQCVKEMANQP